MRRSRLRKASGVALLIAACLVLWQVVAIDGPLVLVAEALFPADTRFAPGYSHFGFWRVRNGDTKDQVRALIGDPVEKGYRNMTLDPDTAEQWFYAVSPSGGNHHVRIVVFSPEGRVSDVIGGYNVD
jgi:outer membrane protein assembly factor BamE (lipoprotein component of BamABCDE complex)